VRRARGGPADRAAEFTEFVGFLTPAFSPGQADPNVPRGATEITVGHGRAWLVPYVQGGAALVVTGDAAGGQVRDLVIGASGLSRAALVSLVSDGLKAA
jgi:hypothetical protein